MTMKIGILGDPNDPAVAELVEALKRQMPDIDVVCAERISETEISVGYRLNPEQVKQLAGDLVMAHTALTGGRLTSDDFPGWPTERDLPKPVEPWREKRRKPWRKRR